MITSVVNSFRVHFIVTPRCYLLAVATYRCYSEASDAFSFGVVLYEMLSRRPPWEGHENLDVAYRVCSGERMEVKESERPITFSTHTTTPRVSPDCVRYLLHGMECLIHRSVGRLTKAPWGMMN